MGNREPFTVPLTFQGLSIIFGSNSIQSRPQCLVSVLYFVCLGLFCQKREIMNNKCTYKVCKDCLKCFKIWCFAENEVIYEDHTVLWWASVEEMLALL